MKINQSDVRCVLSEEAEARALLLESMVLESIAPAAHRQLQVSEIDAAAEMDALLESMAAARDAAVPVMAAQSARIASAFDSAPRGHDAEPAEQSGSSTQSRKIGEMDHADVVSALLAAKVDPDRASSSLFLPEVPETELNESDADAAG